MNRLNLALFGLLGFAGGLEGSPLANHRSDTSPLVNLGYAQYEGTTLNSGVNQFLGIRYAAPPLDDLRWRAPQDPHPQDGVQKAQQVSSIHSVVQVMPPYH